MILEFCSKLGRKIKDVINYRSVYMDSSPSNGVTLVENSNNTVEESKNPINIIINKSTYEYAHGKKFKSDPTWIVIHYTACINATAKQMIKAMKNNTSASSHFYIDENNICTGVPEEYIAWHVGNGECKQPEAYNKKSLKELVNYKAKDWRYDLAANNHLKWIEEGNDFKGNSQSIGVDLCVRKKSSVTKKATDSDWYFTDGTIDNSAKTIAYLANKYNISLDHIIRHSDSTGKLCPRPFVSILPGETNDEKWNDFKEKIKEYMNIGVVANFI